MNCLVCNSDKVKTGTSGYSGSGSGTSTSSANFQCLNCGSLFTKTETTINYIATVTYKIYWKNIRWIRKNKLEKIKKIYG